MHRTIRSNEARLLLANGLFALASGLSGLFTNVYLWRLRPGFATPAYYNLFIMLTVLLVMPGVGWLVKRQGAAVVNAIGTSLYACFYLSLLLLQDQAALHLMPLGILMGLALSTYALAGHVLVYDNTRPETRERFLSHNGLVSSIAGLAAPLCSGWTVSALPGLAGYRVIFTCSFVLFAASAWVAFGLYRRGQSAPYRIWRVFPGRHAGWRRMLVAYGFTGARDGIFNFAVNLLVFLATGGERSLGNYAFLTAAAGLAAYWLSGRYLRPENRRTTLPLGALGMAAATGVLALGPTWGVMLAYGLLSAVANPVWSTAWSATAFDAIREVSEGEGDLRIEMMAAKEIPLNLGRVTALSLFLVWAPHIDSTGQLQILLALLGLVFPVAWLIVRPGRAKKTDPGQPVVHPLG